VRFSRSKPPSGTIASDDPRTQWVGADSILFATAHRPWPAPMAPWIMTQRWNDLLFLHYALPPETVRAVVPEALTLDTYERYAWISVVPFWINHLRPPGVPSMPWVSRFGEVNVRTYVTYGGKPGVYFFSLDAGNLSAVWGARVFYRLPYWHASIKVKGKGTANIDYRSKREHGPKPAELVCSYGPAEASIQNARPGSPEHFLSERYCLYAFNRGRLYRGEIHHLPWPLQPARFDVRTNTMAHTTGLELPARPDLVNFVRELKVLFWAPERLL
jgi:uncharacterized protein YqjF (DUF2071 family)